MRKIPILLLLLIVLSGIKVKAQISFSKEYGGAYNEDGRWMEQMPDSGFILTGGTTTFSNGQTDIWLVRTDAYGNTLWTQSIGGTAFDFANMVKPVTGGFVICGVTNRNGSDDAIILKTDASGNTLWTTVIGDSNIQWFEGFVPTTDGGYTAVGVNTGSGTHGGYDIYLVKFNGSGVKQWEKSIGGGSYEIGNSIQQTADGGYILAGQTYSYGNFDGDYYLVKTDASGNVQWQKTYGRPHLQECHYAQITPDGGYILVGDADTLSNGLGDTDVWMIKTDSLGSIMWDKVYGGSKKDGGKTVENTSDGGFIIAGITRSFGLINPNFYLIKTDGSGNLNWQKTSYGTAYHDHAYRAIETSDFGYAEFGFFRNSAGFQNFALVKLPPNAGVVKDLAIDNIIAPDPIVCRSNNVGLGVLLTNYGATNEQNITVTLLINNGTTTTTAIGTFSGVLAPGTSTVLNFSQTYDFNIDGTYSLKAYMQHRNSDISYTNDTSNITVNVIPPTADPFTTSAVSCNNGSLTLMSTPASSADSMFWYDASINGNLISTGNSFTTPSLNNTTTYYVQSEKGKGSKVGLTDNSGGTGSTSSSGYLKFDSRKIFKLVSVLVYPSVAGNRTIELRNSVGAVLQSKTVNLPIAPGGIRVYLNFNVPQGNDLQLGLANGSANLFRNNSGGIFPYSVSQTVEIYGTNSSNVGTYYYFYDWYVFVPSENCASNRVPVQAIIGSGSTTAFDGYRCGNGSVTLIANSSTTLAWYSVLSGGVALSTSNTYTTPLLSSNTTYYLEEGSCPNRIAVHAIIQTQSAPPTASDVTHCGPGTVTLTASSPDPVFWYNAPSNGTQIYFGSPFNTPYLSSSTTYYAVAGNVCPSTPVAVNAIINAAVIPTVTGATACGPASVTLSASSPDPLTWYNVSTGGAPISTTSSYTTPVLANPVTYYVEAGTICPSPRVPVTANVITIDPPVGTGASHCGNGSLVLSAQSINPITWWTLANGGSQLSSGQIFTTPSLTVTTVYYAQASGNGCNSQRTSVTATVNITTPPMANSVSRCGPGTITLTATAADSIFWYGAASGGSPIGNGTTFITSSLSTTTTYYVQAGSSCPSTRVSVNAVITSLAADPVTSGASRCGGGTVTLSATSADPITWYDAPGGNIIGTGTSFVTPTIAGNTTYYAVAGISGCLSNPVPAVATINTLPASPVGAGEHNCGPAQLTLTASAVNPITWYNQATGGSVLNTGPSYTSTFNITTTVYVETTDGTCISNRVPVTATIYTIPNVNLGPPAVTINFGQTITLDPGAGFAFYLWSTTATTQTINVNTDGVYSVIVTDAHNCQNSDSITVNVINIGITESAIDAALEIYPNPSQGLLNVRVNNQSLRFDLQITDVAGRIIISDNHKINGLFNKTYNLTELSKGIYYFRIFSVEGNATRTLIIQ